MKRSLGTLSLLAVGVSGIMGSGWLISPYLLAKMLGPASIIAWILGALIMVVIASTFAELASTFPMIGGSIRYLHLSHGVLPSYAVAWIGWLSAASVAPIETLASLRYVSQYVPQLMHPVAGQHMLTREGFLVAAALMGIMVVINAVAVKLVSRITNWLLVIKVLVPIAVVVMLAHVNWHPENLSGVSLSTIHWRDIFASLPTAGVVFSYIGYSAAIQLAGEAKNPQRSTVIAILGSLGICCLIFIVIQAAFMASLPPQWIVHGDWSQLHLVNDAGPFAGLMMLLGLGGGIILLYVGAIGSPLGTALIYTASASRIAYAMGDNGYQLDGLLHKNRFGLPGRILLLNYGVGLLMFLPFPTWQRLVGFLAVSFVLSYAAGPLALPVLREKHPDLARGFRLPCHGLLCWLAFYLSNCIILWAGWDTVSKIGVFLLIGYGVLILFRRQLQVQLNVKDRQQLAWLLCYFCGLLLLSAFSSYGGLGWLPMGWDLLVCLMISTIIYCWAVKQGKKTS